MITKDEARSTVKSLLTQLEKEVFDIATINIKDEPTFPTELYESLLNFIEELTESNDYNKIRNLITTESLDNLNSLLKLGNRIFEASHEDLLDEDSKELILLAEYDIKDLRKYLTEVLSDLEK
ncbi:hypothetical protein NDK43_26005 [Neobacillus pocheonensis]|uniref:Immunity protein 30 domain-containing protein n=1 Tax=Neobacillus pocheonensis TaxID=363869 RepID=A0ABT0WG25_9BACI|nr:hypothetical protein [Neobacillus pocheonensis]